MKFKQERDDGRETKRHLLECAGRLAAKKSFSLVTSKEICQMAGCNLSAVNYHFGSREGLYKEMLLMVHQYLVNEDILREIAQKNISPRVKIEKLIDWLVPHLILTDAWILKVWIRAIIDATPENSDVFRGLLKAKGPWLFKIFMDYTGLEEDDTKLYSAIVGFMSPFFMSALGLQNGIAYKDFFKLDTTLSSWIDDLKKFSFAGLEAFCINKNNSL